MLWQSIRLALAVMLLVPAGAAVAQADDSPDASADEAAKVFEDVYGRRLSQARDTRSDEDDAQLAVELIEAARGAAASPPLVRILYETAFDLTHTKRDRYAVAEQAIEALIHRFPRQAEAYREQRLELLQRWYEVTRGPEQDQVGRKLVDAMVGAARNHLVADELPQAETLLARAGGYARRIKSSDTDEIDRLLDRVRSRKRTFTFIRSYESRVANNPDDAAAHAELCRLYLVELDQPEDAAEHVEHTDIEGAGQLMPYVLKPIDEVPDEQLLALGQWYRGLAADASESAQPGLLRRAKDYYTQYLSTPAAAEGMNRSRAALALRQVDQELGLMERPQVAERSMSDWIAFAAARDRLPPHRQIQVIEQALEEVNGMPIRMRTENNPQRITSINLYGNPDITNIMPLYGMKLERLSLRDCKRLKSIDVLRGMPLKSLNLHGCQNLESIAPLADMPLEELSLRMCWNLRGDLSVLRGKPLKELDLAGCDGLDSLAGIEGMPLQSLNLHDCRNITGNLEECRGMKLQLLDISDCDSLDSVSGVDAASVQTLIAERSHLVGENLAGIAHFRPRELSISFNRGLTTLQPLTRMPLETLEAAYMGDQLKPEDYMVLKQIPTLKHLRLDDMRLARQIVPR